MSVGLSVDKMCWFCETVGFYQYPLVLHIFAIFYKMHLLCHKMTVEETNQLNESKIISMHYKKDGSVHFEYNTTAIII